MSGMFTRGKYAIAECDRCGFRYKLRQLKELYVKTKKTNILVCRTCWEKDHPQLMLGMYPVLDPQAVRNPRPDTSYWEGGMTGLRVTSEPPPEAKEAFGQPSGGSRDILWGWNPVGFSNVLGLVGLEDTLVSNCMVGSVEILIS